VALSVVYPVYVVVGPDRFLRNEALRHILDALEGEMDSVGPARMDGSEAGLAEVLDEVRTLSLLGSRRVVVVDDADPFITTHRKPLERYVDKPAEDGCLILLCNTLPKSTRLYKGIAKVGSVTHCEPPTRRAVAGWITQWAREKYGKRITPPTAQHLREHLGDDLGILDAELSKLTAYVGQRAEITPGDIDDLTGQHREEKVFGVTDAISSGDTAGALRHWEQVLATDRAAPGRAIAGLAWGVRRLLQAKREWDRGANIGELARRMFVDPNVLQRRLARVDPQQLERQQEDLLAVDLAVKTGASTVDVAVEKFIVKHSTREASAGA